MKTSKVLLFDNKSNCFASLSRESITIPFLEKVKSLGGSFIDCPLEMVSMISGKEEKESLNAILRDIEKF